MAKLLTTQGVDKLKAGTVRREIPDARLQGLYLIIQTSGAKSWALRYRYGGRPRKMTLGPYPAIDLAKARKRAGDAIEALADGYDPAIAQRHAKARESHCGGDRDAFGSVVRMFIERHARARTRSWAETARLLGLKPDPDTPGVLLDVGGGLAQRWAARDVGKITRRDIIEVLDEAVDRGAPIAANRTLAAIRKLFNWAVGRDVIAVSPCAGLKAPSPEQSRDRVLSDDEIRKLWKAAELQGHPFGTMVQLLLLTGQRRSEVAGLRRSELDLEARVWSLPGNRTKNGLPNENWLSDAALAVLDKVPRLAGTDLLFTGTGRMPVSGFSRAKRALDLASGVAGWTLHDCRRSVATGMAGALGIAPHIVEAVLNHQSGAKAGVAGVYNRAMYAAEKKFALERWAQHVDQIVSGKTATVVAFPGRSR